MSAPNQKKSDQCEGQLFQLLDGLSETLYNAPEGAATYPSAPPSGHESQKASQMEASKGKVVELDEDGKENNPLANVPEAQSVPIIKTNEIPQTEVSMVLETLLRARPDLFTKLRQFTETLLPHTAAADSEAIQPKHEGNKAFIAYQHEAARLKNGNTIPTNQQRAQAQQLLDTAFNNYTSALSRAETDSFVATLLNNRSTVLFAGNQYRNCALDCNYCLKINPTYWKALQRRGMCMVQLGYEAIGNSDIEFAEKAMNEAAEAQKAAAEADLKAGKAPAGPTASYPEMSKEWIAQQLKACEEAKAWVKPPAPAGFDMRFDLHDKLLHAFQNVSNYADQSDEGEVSAGSKTLSAGHRLSAPPTIVALSNKDITVERDAKRGRYVCSKGQLPSGHTVLTETPYAAAQYSAAGLKCCSLCLRSTKLLYPSDDYRKAHARSRGLFCSSECAKMNWELYGERESQNIFYMLCPIDALLASRVCFRQFKQSAVLKPKAHEATSPSEVVEGAVAALMTLATTAAERDHIRIDSVGDNKYGKDYIDSLCAFSKELFPGLAESGGRESVLAAVAQYYSIFTTDVSTAASEATSAVEGVKEPTHSSAATSSYAKDAMSPTGQPQLLTNVGAGTFLSTKEPSAAEKAMAEHFRKVLRQLTVNSFFINFQERIFSGSESHDVANTTLGKGLYAVASLFNHSCDPNCVAVFSGLPHAASAQLSIKTIRPVQEGEELSIAYPALNKFTVHSTRGRIRELRSKYGFACTCNACFSEVDEPIPKDEEQYYHKAADYYQKGRRLMREGNHSESITVLLQSYEIVMRYICQPPRPPQWMLVTTHEALAQSYNMAGNKRKSLEHQRAALSLSLQMYDKHATQIAANLGPLALLGGDHNTLGFAETTTSHPRNHQPDRVGIAPGVASASAISATFLAHPDIQIHANSSIIQSFIRLALMTAAMGRQEKDSAALTDAKKLAERAIALLKLYYPQSPALDAEVLELELVGQSTEADAAQ